MKKTFILIVFFFAAVFSFTLTAAESNSCIITWNPQIQQRQIIAVSFAVPAHTALIEIPSDVNSVVENNSEPFRFIDIDKPADTLPYFRSEKSFFIPYHSDKEQLKERVLLAVEAGKNIKPSPKLETLPKISDDYATVQLKNPWDFENGNASAIHSWGVERNHYGNVSIKDGWLNIPILGDDAYFIFGVMWGKPDDPKNLHIDSKKYRYLELRLRQSVSAANWKFFITDKDGNYREYEFAVSGKEAQNFRFDLKDIFPDFWDGREFKAVRIDPNKKQPNTVAEIDYVKILPDAPQVNAGSLFTLEQYTARSKVKNIKAELAAQPVAGKTTPLKVVLFGTDGKPLGNVPALWTAALKAGGKEAAIVRTEVPFTETNTFLPAFGQAGNAEWTFGLLDDLGSPYLPVKQTVKIKPDVLAGYRLSCKEFVDAADTAPVQIEIQGVDKFGNTLPVQIQKPVWKTEPDGIIVEGNNALQSSPQEISAKVSFRFDGKELKHYRITLTDENGNSGSTLLTSVHYRKEQIRTNENGYMVNADGSLFFPIGGLYANWCHGKPDKNGALNRSIDLFPCSDLPYTAGFPWKPEVEQKVIDYLDHCRYHGLNSLRLMLRNMDIVGRVDPVQLKAVLHYFDLARERGIKFNVVLFEDYKKPPYYNKDILEHLALPHYTKEELAALPPYRARFLVEKRLVKTTEARYDDTDVLKCHQDYLRELIPVLAGREEVYCYELENEIYVQPLDWCRKITAFIRTIDPHTLLLANPQPMYWPRPLMWRTCGADITAFHPYNNGQKDADMGAVFLTQAKWTAQINLPFSTGEGGVYDGQIPYEMDCLEQRVQGARDQIWTTICSGSNGFLYWTVMHEDIIKEFGKIAPALKAVGIDLKTVKRRRPDVAVVMPNEYKPNSSWADSQSAANTRCKSLTKQLLNRGIDFDTPPKGEENEYPAALDVFTTEPEQVKILPTIHASVAAPADGWDVSTLCSADEKTALLYVRNLCGGIKNYASEKSPCYCRSAQAGNASVKLEKLMQWNKIIVYDLDTGETKTVKPDSNGVLHLGKTKSDFVIGLH